jgi:uncharacterized membrane protein YvbJ
VPRLCPECGTPQPSDAARCAVCGAKTVTEEKSSAQIGGKEVLSYGLFVIGLLLIAIGVPCLIGLLCFLAGR